MANFKGDYNTKETVKVRRYIINRIINKKGFKGSRVFLLKKKNKNLENMYMAMFKRNPVDDYVKDKELVKEELKTKQGKIYLIGNVQNKVVKIGYSKTPRQRLKKLQTGSPYSLTIFKTFNGTLDIENKLHKKYKNQKLNGEWFKMEGRLLELCLNN